VTLPPELVEVVCSRCGTVTTAYLQPPVAHEPEPWNREGGRPVSAVCPECGTELGHGGGLERHVVSPPSAPGEAH
jgi:hypothetical protein